MTIEVTGRELCGLTDSELLESILSVDIDTCPINLNEMMTYQPCKNPFPFEVDCSQCYRQNLNKVYTVEKNDIKGETT